MLLWNSSVLQSLKNSARIFTNHLVNGTIFGKHLTWNIHFDFLYNLYLKLFFFNFWKNLVRCPKCPWIFMQHSSNFVRFHRNLNFIDKSYKKSPNMRFNENPSSGSRVVPCGRTARQGDMTKLPVALRNCAQAPTKYIHYKQTYVQKNHLICRMQGPL
jgi:hypothetical protein